MKSTKPEISKFVLAVAGALLALSWLSAPSIAADETAKTVRRGGMAGVAVFSRAAPTLTNAAGSFESAAAVLVRNDLDVNKVLGRNGVTPRLGHEPGPLVGAAGDVRPLIPKGEYHLASRSIRAIETAGPSRR